ncbi:MAG TPA: DUF4239 domain-containing protein [Anaerohalosphaeraceae bacterium]|nr:DUF4239 domain-containing protein [Anaerohalosphaeraceae bacterium]
MSAAGLGIIAFLCVVVGMVAGLLLRNSLPDHHLSGDSRDAVKMGAGLIATLSALVLGLLISSAKDSFDAMNHAITESSAKLIMLDRILAQYGPQTQVIRNQLRHSVIEVVALVWPEQKTDKDTMSTFEESPATMELVAARIRELSPQNDTQKVFQSEAIGICRDLLQTRWLVIERAQLSLPMAFIVVLLFWLTMLFGTFGVLAPANKTAVAALAVCAISVGGAIFLIEEMNRPLGGMVKVSSAPILKAIEHLGK